MRPLLLIEGRQSPVPLLFDFVTLGILSFNIVCRQQEIVSGLNLWLQNDDVPFILVINVGPNAFRLLDAKHKYPVRLAFFQMMPNPVEALGPLSS